jgi:hypothetical protein
VTDLSETIWEQLSSLVESNADCFDPVRFGYIESMARRSLKRQGLVRLRIERKLHEALVDYQSRLDRARAAAADVVARVSAKYPDSADQIGRLFKKNDFKKVQRLGQRLESGNMRSALAAWTQQLNNGGIHANEENTPERPFCDLLKQQEDNVVQSIGNSWGHPASDGNECQAELSSYRLIQQTWVKFQSERLVSLANHECPENSGHLNSQMLVTRSLGIMRDLSPSYLNRFVSYIDTLLWLERAAEEIEAAFSSGRGGGKSVVKRRKHR